MKRFILLFLIVSQIHANNSNFREAKDLHASKDATSIQHGLKTLRNRTLPNHTLYSSRPSNIYTEVELTKFEIQNVQRKLKKMGFLNTPVSGVMDAPTQQAVRSFQKENNMIATSVLNDDTVKKINSLQEE